MAISYGCHMAIGQFTHLQPNLPAGKIPVQMIRYLSKAAAIAVMFCATTVHATGNAIVIGQSIDLSGPNESIGRDYVAGIKTYFDMVNSAGGINGRRIHYLTRDDRGQPDLALKLSTELIESDRADYLMGGVGDTAVAAVTGSAAFRKSGHILFAPLASAEQEKSGRILFWRPDYKQEIRYIFDHFRKLGVKSVAIAYQESALSAQAYRGATAELAVGQLKLGGSVRLDGDNANIAQEAAQLASTRPGMVLVIADTIGTALFLKEYRKHDAQTFVAGTSLTNLSTLHQIAGARATEWTVFSQVVPNPNAATSLLQMEHLNMMRRYRDEAVSALTLEGFAAAKVLVKAIQQEKMTRRALHELVARNGQIELGGLVAIFSGKRNYLSSYIDIALFNKGGSLKF